MSVVKQALTLRWVSAVSEATGYLSAVAMVVATVVMLHGVASRYFFGLATVWQTEVSVYLLLVVAFWGAAYGLKHHAHVGVDVMVDRLPPRGRLVARILTSLLSLGVVLVIVWKGGQLWWEAYEGGFRSPTAFRAPLGVVYAILPIGMILVALQYLALIIEAVSALLGRTSQAQALAAMSQTDPMAKELTEGPVLEPDPAVRDERGTSR